MTAQEHDLLEHRGAQLLITGVQGEGFFDPAHHGLSPVPFSTACWRGFVSFYTLIDRRLHLDKLKIFTVEDLPVLFGSTPRTSPDDTVVRWNYVEMAHPVRFTGGLLAATGFIRELYVHMGFHPAWKFRQVHEFQFHDGRLIGDRDRSAEAEDYRQKALHDPSLDDRSIGECFGRSYDSWAL